ncbi:MAG: hypothetical protein KKB79_03625 [Nanoarchaeota archaeon]|nr:hypothetical protein [Nanoarchaeota archaeon]
MPAQDTSAIKEKIVSIIRLKGPSIPVSIAKEIGLDILFTSAFLSELVSEKRIKMSHMRIGSSPLYLIQGQEKMIGNFSQHLKSKEKEAFNILKEKGILKDKEQNPPLRVALREIRDFAIPFREPKSEEIYWRFITHNLKEIERKETGKHVEEETKKSEPLQEKSQEIKEPEKKVERNKENDLGIFDKSKKPKKKKQLKKKASSQKENIFFNKVKVYLNEKSIELSDILTVNKNEIILKVKGNNTEQILIAYNKKRLNENDIIKASKKAREFGLRYIVISNGGILKKTEELISAIKNLQATGELRDNNV